MPSPRVLSERARNRLLRPALAEAHDIRAATAKGQPRTADAQRLAREVAFLARGVNETAALFRSKVQHVQNHVLNPGGLAAVESFKALGPIGIKGLVPAVIARARAGDDDAMMQAGALITVLSGMDQTERPMSPSKLARMIPTPEYDAVSVELAENLFMLDALNTMLPRLSTGQMPPANEMIEVGIKQRQLRDGAGLRDAAELAADDAELSITPPPQEEEADADGRTEPEQADDASRQDIEREADPADDADRAADRETDANAEDQSGTSREEGQ